MKLRRIAFTIFGLVKENGAMGPAELCGEIGPMDFLVGVQDEQLVGLTFNETMQHLREVFFKFYSVYSLCI